MGRYDEAESELDLHQRLVEAHDDAEGLSLQTMWQGIVAYCRNDLDEADALLRTAQKDMPAVLRSGRAFARLHAAKTTLARGRLQRAVAAGRIVQDLGRRLGEPRIESEALLVEAEAEIVLGGRERAAGLIDAATRLLGTANARRLGSKIAAARAEWEADHDAREAAAWLGASDALVAAMGAQRPIPEQQRFGAVVERVRAELGAPEYATHWGRANRLEVALARLGGTGHRA
jgi:ATP/maltotriose-dependent transcriptional regulator MalT